MDQVFAPWRIEWIERDDRNADIDGCPFCALPDRPAAEDRENYLLARGEHAFALLNNYPYNPGHLMVIPYEHEATIRNLPAETHREMMRLKGLCIEAVEDAMGPDGFNVGYNLGGAAAGGSIDDHVHAHVVPRWTGDTNFMPVVGDTKVIVEAIEGTYDRVHETFASLDGVEDPGPARAVRIA